MQNHIYQKTHNFYIEIKGNQTKYNLICDLTIKKKTARENKVLYELINKNSIRLFAKTSAKKCIF